MTFALMIIFIAVPLFILGTKTEPSVRGTNKTGEKKLGKKTALMNIFSGPIFWLLALSFTTIAVGHGLLITHLLPLLAERNISNTLAVTAASMIGPMQVAGRVVMIFAERYVSMYAVCGATFICILFGVGALIFAGANPTFVFVFVILHGSGYGVTSITRPVVTVGMLGSENFGAISGVIALCFMSGFALSPLLAARIWEWGGYDLVLKIICFTVFVGMLSYLLALWSTREVVKKSI
jgi:predicted MFS family arabinose efflux permease